MLSIEMSTLENKQLWHCNFPYSWYLSFLFFDLVLYQHVYKIHYLTQFKWKCIRRSCICVGYCSHVCICRQFCPLWSNDDIIINLWTFDDVNTSYMDLFRIYWPMMTLGKWRSMFFLCICELYFARIKTCNWKY